MLEIKKYYFPTTKFVLVYPTQNIAAMAVEVGRHAASTCGREEADVPAIVATTSETLARLTATWWTQNLGAEILVAKPKDIFYLADTIEDGDQIYLYCISPKFVGWIVWARWLKFEEITPVSAHV